MRLSIPTHYNPDTFQRAGLEIWKRELSDGSYAMAFVSQRVDGAPYAANFTYFDMQLPQKTYVVEVSFTFIFIYLGSEQQPKTSGGDYASLGDC